jgi:hypothetical protein
MEMIELITYGSIFITQPIERGMLMAKLSSVEGFDGSSFGLRKFGPKERLESLQKGIVYMNNFRFFVEREKIEGKKGIVKQNAEYGIWQRAQRGAMSFKIGTNVVDLSDTYSDNKFAQPECQDDLPHRHLSSPYVFAPIHC